MENDEMLSFYDDKLNYAGISTRSEIHSKGLLHQVVHCWIVDDSCNEKWIYFQQRSYKKKDFPGLYDISAAGHIDIGEDIENAVKREVTEEIGLEIDTKKLKYIGNIREERRLSNFHNNELCHLYLYNIKNPKFILGDEVEKMVKISLHEFKRYALGNSNDIIAFSLDKKYKFELKREEFCVHERHYLETIINFI
ncbi:NUDIX domain-containing protein [Clostridium sp.]|uniref:NUDIX hydrolase n=1 Tax=Clostridium sp. TaxID=1506 RepID=UPI0026378802|nr:NUDIX domain-containing protein [Clostridium sp.]